MASRRAVEKAEADVARAVALQVRAEAASREATAKAAAAVAKAAAMEIANRNNDVPVRATVERSACNTASVEESSTGADMHKQYAQKAKAQGRAADANTAAAPGEQHQSAEPVGATVDPLHLQKREKLLDVVLRTAEEGERRADAVRAAALELKSESRGQNTVIAQNQVSSFNLDAIGKRTLTPREQALERITAKHPSC